MLVGLEWHPRIPNEKNHLIYDDLPLIIMDPYEECRGILHGSCLKRYSDSTYFRRASSNLIIGNKKFQKDEKYYVKKKSSSRSRDMARLASMANQSARKTFTSFSFSGQTSSSKSVSTSDMEKRSHLQDHHSRSFDSRSCSGYIECLSTATSSLKAGEKPKGVYVSSSLTPGSCTNASVLSACETEDAHDNSQFSPPQGEAARGSSCVSWDEKAEIVESVGLQTDEASEMMETNSVAKSESGLQEYSGIDEVREIKTALEIVGEPRDSERESERKGDCFVESESENENDQGLQNESEGDCFFDAPF
ncbi:unnamed protein product [Arabis nemorensis]|uniref:Protein SCAR n=1 Tax=Arabis nemorensis TaxID=586526 RepID=A0A565C8B5_9BRAS|nr:unnamed protein product [Arabis nemorensis]